MAVLTLVALPADAPAYSVMTSAQKQAMLIDMMEDFVQRTEDAWCEKSDPIPEDHCNPDWQIPEADGYFAAAGDGVDFARGNVGIAIMYGTLIASNPSQSSWGGTPKTDLIAHAQHALRHVANTNALFDDAGGVDPWGGPACTLVHCLAPNMAGGLAWATQLLWSSLSQETRGWASEVIAEETNIVDDLGPESGPTMGQSFAEENGQSAHLLAVAHAFFPSYDTNGTWAESAKKFAYNVSSRAADESDTTVMDGQQVKDWVTTVNLFDDFTLRNHGFFHPVYSQGVFGDLSNPAVYYTLASQPVPEAFSFRLEEVWDGLLGRLAWEDGDLVLPVGTDWIAHDFQHIQYLAYVATKLGRADASVLESRAIEQLRARQLDNGEGSLYGQEWIGYEADIMRMLTGAWWVHETLGPAPTPTEGQFDTARAASDGVLHSEAQTTVVGRMRDALVSMSWQHASDAEPTALIVPASRNHLTDPVFSQYLLRSGPRKSGTVPEYGCTCNANDFSTAATIGGTRKFSLTAFSDGATILLDRGTGETFTFAFENYPGLGARPVYSSAGVAPGAGPLAGDWLNVADRFGMITKGGSGQSLEIVDDQDGPLPENPRDNPFKRISGSTDTGSGNRGAFVIPLATHSETNSVSGYVQQPGVPNSDWSALTARALDGTSRMAVAHWGTSSATGTISGMSHALGAPIPDRPNDVTVTGSSGSTSFTLDGPISEGYKGYFWVQSSPGTTVVARPSSETLVRLTNGAASTTATVNHDDGGPGDSQASNTLAAGAVAYATPYNGNVRIVTPSASSVGTGDVAAFAFDSVNSTYWSSASTTLTAPECLVLDLGASVPIGRLTMVPRSGFGPKDYTVQTAAANTSCSSTTGWTTRATVTNSANNATPQVHTWTPASARYVRIRVTAAHGSSPFSVGVRQLTPAAS